MKFYQLIEEEKGQLFFCLIDLNDKMTTFNTWSENIEDEHDQAQLTKQTTDDFSNHPIKNPENWKEISFMEFKELKKQFYGILNDHDKP